MTKVTPQTLSSGAALTNLNESITIDFTRDLSTTGNLDVAGNAEVLGSLLVPNQALGSDSSVLTRKLFNEFPFAGAYQPYYDLPKNAGWSQGVQGAGSSTGHNPHMLTLAVGQVNTAYAILQLSNLIIAPLGSTTVTGYSRIDFTGKVFLDIVSIMAFGITTSPFNQYRGVRFMHGLGRYRSTTGDTQAGKGMVSAMGAGFLLYTTSDTSYTVRLVKPCLQNSGNVITGATNPTAPSPIVITTQANHLLENGELVEVLGVNGNTAANGIWTVANKTANTFELQGSTGNGTYTSGGQWHAVSPVLYTHSGPFTLTRYTMVVQGGVAYLYINGNLVGSMSGFSTAADRHGCVYHGLDNIGPVDGLVGGANYYVTSVRAGALY